MAKSMTTPSLDIGRELLLNIADGEVLTFEVVNVDVSVINSLRRVILTHIPTLVFRGFPHYSNKIQIQKNNTKFNNEYLKHRISCIPIFESNESRFENLKNTYEIRASVVNKENKMIYVTTKDFKLFNKETNKENKEHELFPPDPISNDHILICCLMPKISETDEPEELTLKIDFDIGTAKENSCWNVVSKCMYENMRDTDRIEAEVKRLGLKEEAETDFRILDAQRLFIPFHYMMTVESNGVFGNQDIVIKACDYIKERLTDLNVFLGAQTGLSEPTFVKEKYGIFQDKENMNLYNIRIEHDDYTIGKLIEKYLYHMFSKEIHYISFKKEHPHDTFCFVNFAYKKEVEFDRIIHDLTQVTEQLIRIYDKIEQSFRKK
jgi:DNA-directed RNA polymerase subunit L